MAETSGDIRKVIEANNGKWNDAFNRGDARAVMSLYVDDAKLLPPTNAVVSGSQEIRAFWESMIKNGFANHAIEIVEVRAIGDMAYEAAKWRATGPGKDGGEQSYSGNLVNIFERQSDGSWKSRLHTWN
jgi:uncharacterized protein (TIGR02246 family)